MLDGLESGEDVLGEFHGRHVDRCSELLGSEGGERPEASVGSP